MLAGCCTNAIGASVKQGEVKKQEVAVLYLADYPHASSRLQGERADSLNRQEQAAHRPHDTQFALARTLTATVHHPVLTHKLTEHRVLFRSLFRKNTQTVAQSIYQAYKGIRDFQTIQIGNTLQTSTFYEDAKNNLGRRTIHKLLKPV